MMPVSPNGWRDGFVETASGRIHYVSGGAGSPLFLIHGGHGGWVHWHANLPALAQRHSVFAFEMPGFGQSGNAPADCSLADMARMTGDAIAALRANLPQAQWNVPVHLAAFSFGALVATELALQQPQSVRSLLLVNPPGLGEVSAQARNIQARAAEAARLHGLRAGLEISLRELMLCQPARADKPAMDLLEYGVRNTRFVSRGMSRSTALLPMLAALRMRMQGMQGVHVVLGENDPHQRHELARRRECLEQALGKGNVSVFSGAAHWLQFDQPERFNALAHSLFDDFLTIDRT